ncbi:MAG: DUF4445 domain-containing protein [Proteobacteria bacterium]|nr:DUF4445 domain-containing protein [Pseudomonadota bacterium]
MEFKRKPKKRGKGKATKFFEVVYLPDEKKATIEKGVTLLEAAGIAGVHINNVCGGQGVCGKCKVKISGSTVADRSKYFSILSKEELQEGYILACQTPVEGNVEVEIPPESRMEGEQILTEGGAVAYSEPAYVERHPQEEAKVPFYSPLTSKVYLQLPHPSLKDNLSDLDRIYRELRRKWDIPVLDIDLDVIQRLARLLRQSDWKITVTLGREPQGLRILQVEPGDTSKKNFGVAVDVGTTTVVVQLVNLVTGQVVASYASHNSQIRYGEDVISRMIYACDTANGLGPLNQAVIGNINELIQRLVRSEGVSLEDVTAILVAGNTTMTHLLLGLEPCFIRLEPYIPTADTFPVLKAAEAGIRINPYGLLACMPGVSSYVGGDITAGVLASGIDDSSHQSILIDIGTNGEIVLGNNEWLVCCSASAGPAFEGGGTKCGMRAVEGAIQSASISDGQVEVSTIGGAKPLGICGSGFIDIIGGLFENALIHPDGKFDMDQANGRLKKTEEGVEFVLVFGKESGTGKDIAVTEFDISNLIKSKAAVFAAARVLVRSVGLDFSAIDRVFVAGGFGNYLNIEKAITIGLLPDLPLDRFQFIGNSSVAGARIALVSNHAFEKAETVAKKMTYFELSVRTDFMDEFIAALFLPHTNQKLFPTVMGRGIAG